MIWRRFQLALHVGINTKFGSGSIIDEKDGCLLPVNGSERSRSFLILIEGTTVELRERHHGR